MRVCRVYVGAHVYRVLYVYRYMCTCVSVHVEAIKYLG